MKSVLCMGLALLSWAGSGWAGDAPFRPYPDIPDVLFYDSFENTDVKGLYNNASIYTNASTPPTPGSPPPLVAATGDKCLRINKSNENNTKKVNMSLVSSKARLTLMGSLEANRTTVAFKYYSDTRCETWLVCHTGSGDYIDKQSLNDTKGQWLSAQFRLSDTRNKALMLKPDTVVNDIELAFFPKPPNPDKFPVVMIDDLLFGYQTPAEQLMPLVLAKEMRNHSLEKTPEKDGFEFNAGGQSQIPTYIKSTKLRRSRKTVLVVGGSAEQSQSLAKAMEANGPKKKFGGYKFPQGGDADGVAMGGMDDSKLLLPYAIQKSNAGWVLLQLAPEDALDKKGSDALHTLLDRSLSMGAIPVVCLPALPDGGDRLKIDNFNKTARALLSSMNLPWVEQSFVAKAGAAKGDAFQDALAGLAVSTFQTVIENLPPNM